MLARSEALDDRPFRSLAELRFAHAALMRESRKLGGSVTPERVADFIKRATAAGTVIDNQNDRDSAQGVIDYWAAWQFAPGRGGSVPATPPTLHEFVPTEPVKQKPESNPYVGLRAFDEKDTALFIGREEATRALLSKVRNHRMTFVSGPLGCGKSSLVFAGVVPRLRSRAVLETGKEPLVITVIPGSDPIVALLKAVLNVAANRPADPDGWLSRQLSALVRKPETLGSIIETVGSGLDVVLIIDQFEETFTLCTDQERREKFTRAIAGLVKDLDTANRVILIIRADYAQQSYADVALQPLAADPDVRFSPPLLTSSELVRVINSSAEAAGLSFDAGIVEDLAQDVAGDPGSLPTLQFTLSRLWASLPADSNRITRDIYAAVGKPRHALAQAAEAVFSSLTPEQQKIAQRTFLELVLPTLGDDVQRLRVPLDHLALLTGESTTHVESVMQRFEDAELVRRRKGFDADDDRFEIAHEALVKNWRRLHDWLNVKKEESAKQLQLITTARLWRESGQNRGYLLATEDAINDALPYRDHAPEIRDLISASEAALRRYNRIQRTAGALLVLLFAAITTAYVWLSVDKTDLSRKIDERDEKIQTLEDRLALAEGSTIRLKEAETTISEQQKLIEELRKQLRQPAPPAPPPALPQEIAPDLSSTGQEGWVWIGSQSDPNLRDGQNSSVVPSAVDTNKLYVMGKNVVLRSDRPSDTYAQSQSLGLVPAGTPVKALGAAVPYDRPSGTKQYWLRVRVDASNKPIVYYQLPKTAKQDAQPIADAIAAKGYRIPDIKAYDIAKGLNEVRYFFPADKPAAVKLANDVTQALRNRGLNLSQTKVVDPTSPPIDRNYPGVLELWLDTSPR